MTTCWNCNMVSVAWTSKTGEMWRICDLPSNCDCVLETNCHLCSNGHIPHEPGLASSPWSSAKCCYWWLSDIQTLFLTGQSFVNHDFHETAAVYQQIRTYVQTIVCELLFKVIYQCACVWFINRYYAWCKIGMFTVHCWNMSFHWHDCWWP